MKLWSVPMAAAVLVAGLFVAAPASAADKAGVIDGETWTEAGGPYRITGPLVVGELEVEEGAEIVVQGDFPITVMGTLTVQGESDNPVVITFKTETEDGWPGIRFGASQEGSTIEWAKVSYARTGIATNSGIWTIEDSEFSNNGIGADLAGPALGQDPEGRFRSNYVAENGTGVRAGGELRTFDLNTITANGTGISFMTMDGRFSRNNISGNAADDASSCDMLGDGEINAKDNWWGTTDGNKIAEAICDGTDADQDASPEIDFGSFEAGAILGSAQPIEPSPSPSPSFTTSPSPVGRTPHARLVTLTLRRHLRARGTASVPDGFTGCMPATVAISRKRADGTWREIKSVPVDAAGAYSTRLRDRTGAYRASLAEFSTESDLCGAATSSKVRHRH